MSVPALVFDLDYLMGKVVSWGHDPGMHRIDGVVIGGGFVPAEGLMLLVLVEGRHIYTWPAKDTRLEYKEAEAEST